MKKISTNEQKSINLDKIKVVYHKSSAYLQLINGIKGIIKRRVSKIAHTYKHKKAFLSVERKLLGFNTILGYLHDVDKIFMYILTPFSLKFISKVHRYHSKHHDNNRVKCDLNYLQMVIDWECARITKPDKPLNAYQTLNLYYPHLRNKVLPILKKYDLISK